MGLGYVSGEEEHFRAAFSNLKKVKVTPSGLVSSSHDLSPSVNTTADEDQKRQLDKAPAASFTSILNTQQNAKQESKQNVTAQNVTAQSANTQSASAQSASAPQAQAYAATPASPDQAHNVDSQASTVSQVASAPTPANHQAQVSAHVAKNNAPSATATPPVAEAAPPSAQAQAPAVAPAIASALSTTAPQAVRPKLTTTTTTAPTTAPDVPVTHETAATGEVSDAWSTNSTTTARAAAPVEATVSATGLVSGAAAIAALMSGSAAVSSTTGAGADAATAANVAEAAAGAGAVEAAAVKGSVVSSREQALEESKVLSNQELLRMFTYTEKVEESADTQSSITTDEGIVVKTMDDDPVALRQYLTQEDHAFLAELKVGDELKWLMGLMIAMDRREGRLTGAIDEAYLFGDQGLFSRVGPQLDESFLEGERTDTMLEVMANMRKFAHDVVEALKSIHKLEEARKDDPSVNVYNLANGSNHVDAWLKNYFRELEADEQFKDKLSEKAGMTRDVQMLDVIANSYKLLL